MDVGQAPAEGQQVLPVARPEVRDDERDLGKVASHPEQRQRAHPRVGHHPSAATQEAEVDERRHASLGQRLPQVAETGILERKLGPRAQLLVADQAQLVRGATHLGARAGPHRVVRHAGEPVGMAPHDAGQQVVRLAGHEVDPTHAVTVQLLGPAVGRGVDLVRRPGGRLGRLGRPLLVHPRLTLAGVRREVVVHRRVRVVRADRVPDREVGVNVDDVEGKLRHDGSPRARA